MAIQAEVLEAQVRVTGAGEAVRDLNRVSRASGDTGRQVTSAGKSMKAAFLGLGLGAAAVGGVKLLKSTADAASDLNETVSMSAAIFGKNQKSMERWADGAWKSVGLGKNAALAAAAGFGDMFAQLGFTGREAAKMSKTVVQMSADLGSFKNLKTAEVTDMMAAAFRGEYDSLQRVIPNINAARVETEALAETHKKSAKELTAAEKAQATLNIVMKDGKRAQGDFARTSSGAANQQKILQAQIENTKTKVGNALLPAYREFWQFSNEKVVPGINDFVDGMKSGEGAGGTFAKTVKRDIVPVLKDLAETGKELMPFFKGLGTLTKGAVEGFTSLPAPLRSNILLLGGMSLAFSKLTGVLGPTIANMGTAAGRGQALTNTYMKLGGAARLAAGGGGLLLLSSAMKETSQGAAALKGAAGGALSGAALGAFAGPPGAAIGAAVGGLAGGLLGLAHNTRETGSGAREAQVPLSNYVSKLVEGAEAARKMNRETARTNLTQSGTLEAGQKLGIAPSTTISAALGDPKAIKAVAKAMAEARQEATGMVLVTDAMGVSTYRMGTANREVSEAVGNLGVRLGINQEKFRADTIAANEAALAVKDYGSILPGIKPKVATRIEQIGLKQAETQIVKLARKYDLTPEQVQTILKATGGPASEKVVDRVMEKVKNLDGKTATVKTKVAPPTGFGAVWAAAQAWANGHPVTIPTKSKGSALGGTITRGMASGGTVPGARRPYGDKVWRMLAPGEEVITNERGQADSARPLLKYINAHGMAKGGTVGGGLGSALGGLGLTEAVKVGLGPVSSILRRMERMVAKRTSGARENRLEKILRTQGNRLEKLQKRRDAKAAELERAITKRDNLVQARADFKGSVTEGIQSQANVLQAGNSASQIAANLGTQVAKANEFAKAIQDMRKAGYSSAVIQQVASAGIEGGLEVAKALVAGSSGDVASINKSFGAITSAANTQGELLASQFYDAGIKSANGVVKGLNSQKSEIEKSLVIIAKGMVKALRKALGIKSPSVKFAAEMDWVGKGITKGLGRQHTRVSNSASSLAGAVLGGYRSGTASSLTTANMTMGNGRGAVHLEFNSYNPVAEPQSRTTNKALDRVAALGLTG